MLFYTMKHSLIILVIILLGINNFLTAQTSGSVSGKITDNKTNEELIGANVLINGTSIGASTDIDGFYRVSNIPAGIYDLKISYISYQTIVIEKIEIKAGTDLQINVSLDPAAAELQEVVVTAEALKSTEVSVLKIIKNSENIVDGISAELISKNNSSDGADILKRMTGVNISEGKYAVIRGVGDRYNNTLLNGANIPGTDPEKKSFSYDLFPASLIENIVTSKTFTPDKPADFSGGLVQINTMEFPPGFFLDVSTSSSFNSLTSGKEFLSYSGGSKDFFGYDDGTRNIPSVINGDKVVKGNYSNEEISNITAAFSNNWNTNSNSAPYNGSFKLSLGDKLFTGKNNVLGYVGSLTYSNSSSRKNFEQKSYAFDGERYNYTGANYSREVVWGGLLNISYKFGASDKLSFKNIYNRNAEDETVIYSGNYTGASQFREVTSLRYVSRSLLSNQLLGEHHFGLLKGMGLEWNLSYSQSERDEPDARRFIYSREFSEPDDPMRFQLDQSLATRYYGSLADKNISGTAAFNLKLSDAPEIPKLKTGFTVDRKNRDFNARIFGFRNIPGGNFIEEDSILQLPVDRIFIEENINNKFIEVTEITKPSDSYTSGQNIYAGFIMFDGSYFSKLRVSLGIRHENSSQRLNSFSQTGSEINVNENYNDWLPALNLTYFLSETMNLRFGFSKTLARPEFRELAPFSYFDFTANELVIGNENLKRSLIQNYDLRYEVFPGAGELAALSIFYKKFNDPIEQILVASSSFEPIRSYANGRTANNYGAEFELRKSLSFISDLTEDISFIGNVTYIKSEIQISEKDGFQNSKRPMQGQADYIINTGLYYDNNDIGLTSSLIFNKTGHKIEKVGFAGIGDVIELPRDQIDFAVSKNIFTNFNLKISVRNILDREREFIQRTPEGDKTSQLERTGRTFSAGISYQFN
jgi:outer membrane receptor protein involved in Fe transport